MCMNTFYVALWLKFEKHECESESTPVGQILKLYAQDDQEELWEGQ